jgi:hypothetical protein
VPLRYESTWEVRPDIGRFSIGNGISLLTRDFPTYRHYKSIVEGPDAMLRAIGGCEFTYDTEDGARNGHADLMRAINQWYFAAEVA